MILTGDAPLLASRADHRARRGVRRIAGRHGAAVDGSRSRRCRTAGSCATRAAVLAKIVEHPDATPEQRAINDTNAGFYAIRLGHLRKDLAALRADNAKAELYLTDLVAHAYARGGATAIDAPFTEVTGINDRVDLAAVEADGTPPHQRDWMRAGVTMIDPASTFIDADVGPLGKDVMARRERRAARQDDARRRRARRSRLGAHRRDDRRDDAHQAVLGDHRVAGRRARRRSARSATAARARASTRTSTSATSSRPRRPT